MTLEAYSYCPGGTGKRIKHCACRDIAGELDKIIKAVEGGQRIAALDRINRALATRANRPCLLTLKITTLLGMNNMQGLEETVTTFLKVAADNPMAHVFAAMLEARKHHLRAAVDSLQNALVLASAMEGVPAETAGACAEVAQELLNQREFMAAVAHYHLLYLMVPDDPQAPTILNALYRADGVPLGLKKNLDFEPCPEHATWRSRFESAQSDVRRFLHRRGLEKFEKLNQDFPNQPAILWNIAVARSILAMPAVEAYRAYATCEGAPPARAVEAELAAQMLTRNSEPITVDLVQVTIPIAEVAEVQERLLASRRAVSMSTDQYEQLDENAPPPKAVFALLDRPRPEDGAALTSETIPRILTLVALFGRETDRPARVVYACPQSDTYREVPAALAEIAGEQLSGAEESREVTGQIELGQAELFARCYAQGSTTISERSRASNDVMREQFRTRWSHLPQPALDGKTPAEVASDPAYRIRLTATLNLLEQTTEAHGWEIDVDRLRADLGVPIPDPIDLTTVQLNDTAPTEWSRLLPDRMSDDDLEKSWRLADQYAARRAGLNLGEELLRRAPLSSSQLDLSYVCEQMAHWTQDPDKMLEYMLKARRYAVANGDSPAMLLINELPLRLARGEHKEATRLMAQVQRDHIREPGVAEALHQMLTRFGVVAQNPEEGAAPEPVAVTAAAGPAGASAVWTPSSVPPPAQEPKTSTLWLPD